MDECKPLPSRRPCDPPPCCTRHPPHAGTWPRPTRRCPTARCRTRRPRPHIHTFLFRLRFCSPGGLADQPGQLLNTHTPSHTHGRTRRPRFTSTRARSRYEVGLVTCYRGDALLQSSSLPCVGRKGSRITGDFTPSPDTGSTNRAADITGTKTAQVEVKRGLVSGARPTQFRV
jgi:hypothetical protein